MIYNSTQIVLQSPNQLIYICRRHIFNIMAKLGTNFHVDMFSLPLSS